VVDASVALQAFEDTAINERRMLSLGIRCLAMLAGTMRKQGRQTSGMGGNGSAADSGTSVRAAFMTMERNE
jgi:hypothetical protein